MSFLSWDFCSILGDCTQAPSPSLSAAYLQFLVRKSPAREAEVLFPGPSRMAIVWNSADCCSKLEEFLAHLPWGFFRVCECSRRNRLHGVDGQEMLGQAQQLLSSTVLASSRIDYVDPAAPSSLSCPSSQRGSQRRQA